MQADVPVAGAAARPRGGSALKPSVSTVDLAELAPADVERWRELANAAAEPNPFFEPDFVLPLYAAMAEQRPELLVCTSRGEWLAALPVCRKASWRRIPLAGTVSWKSPYTYFGVPLLHRDHPEAAARALLIEVVRGRRYFGLELLGRDGPAWSVLDRAARELGLGVTLLRSYDRAALNRRADPATYVMLKPKHRRELRRLRDRLGDDIQAPIEDRDESASAAAIDEFLRLETSGWKGERATAMAAVPGHAEMFRRICRSFAEHGRLQLLTLRAGERTLAAKCNLLAGDGAFCFKIAFDEQWARYSPGVQLELANVHRFHGRPELKWMDSCAEPSNQMINRLWPDRRPIAVAAVTAGGIGRAAEGMFRAAAQARKLIRRGDSN